MNYVILLLILFFSIYGIVKGIIALVNYLKSRKGVNKNDKRD